MYNLMPVFHYMLINKMQGDIPIVLLKKTTVYLLIFLYYILILLGFSPSKIEEN